ncbi:L-lactate permease [Shigella flexneri]
MPIDMAFAAAGYGFIYGLWRCSRIIVAAVFLYKLTVARGEFDLSAAGYLHHRQSATCMSVRFSLVRCWKERLARCAVMPVRCWWAWASNRYTRRGCV